MGNLVGEAEAKIVDFDYFRIGFHYGSRQRSEIGHLGPIDICSEYMASNDELEFLWQQALRV